RRHLTLVQNVDLERPSRCRAPSFLRRASAPPLRASSATEGSTNFGALDNVWDARMRGHRYSTVTEADRDGPLSRWSGRGKPQRQDRADRSLQPAAQGCRRDLLAIQLPRRTTRFSRTGNFQYVDIG